MKITTSLSLSILFLFASCAYIQHLTSTNLSDQKLYSRDYERKEKILKAVQIKTEDEVKECKLLGTFYGKDNIFDVGSEYALVYLKDSIYEVGGNAVIIDEELSKNSNDNFFYISKGRGYRCPN